MNGQGVVERIVRQAAAKRGIDYAGEVRRLLDAGLELMRTCGTTSRPRVADIVAAAGLSNDAFYRYFDSKDALVAAILLDGTERLATYLAHQMAKEPSPQGKVGRWVEGVLSQAIDGDVASTTLAVLWNAGGIGEGHAAVPTTAPATLGALLREPFAELGSTHPDLDASLAAHATLGKLADYLWTRARPANRDVEEIAAFWVRAATRSGDEQAERSQPPVS